MGFLEAVPASYRWRVHWPILMLSFPMPGAMVEVIPL
jgi:hypothetical protein